MERHEDAGNGLSSLSEPSSSSLNNGKQKGVENKKKEPKSVSFLKLFAFADSYDFLLMSVGSVGGIGNGVGMPLMTLLFGELIQTFGSTQDTHSIVSKVSKVCLKFVYLAVGVAVAAFLQVCCWIVTGERQAARIRGLYLKAILRQDVGYFDKETSTGEVVSRMSGDTVLIQDAMGEKVGKTVQLITNFIGGFTIAFIRGWQLALVMVSVIPLLVVAGATISRFMSQMAARGQSAYANAANVVEQTIGSIRTVASFTGEKQAISSYQKFLVDAYKSGVREALGGGIGIGTVMLVIFCTYSLAVWFGGKMIIEKGYDGGQVITIILAVLEASMSLGQILPCFSAFASGRAAASKMFETIQRKPSIDVYDPKGKTLDDIQGDIDLKDVTFSYPTRPDEAIFSGFSLHIPRGTTAALVGESGSGKSTVISLIERFYDPQSGEVLIDGVNLKEFRLRWIRAKIGLVSQEPILFTASIKDNIAYGKDDATNEEIKSACELANAAKFIDKLPQGLHTLVGEHGTQLSGGQKQRIAIARAILKDPRILLLDEATSALDAESESVVQEALDRIMVNRTTVIVAHRLSTVRNADMIAVIHRGKMVQKGSHSKLIMNPSGAYSQLIRLQETNKDSKHASEVVNRTEFSLESMRQSSQRAHCLRSISRGSSVAHSSRRSLSMFGLTSEHDLTDDCDVEGMIEEQLKAPPVSLRRLAALNKPEIPMLLMGTIGTVMCGVILPIFGLLLSNVIKTYYKPPEMLKKDTKCWAIIYIVLGVASLVAHPWRAYFFSVAGCKLIERIRSLCFEKVVHMEVSWFDEAEHSSGAIGARLSSDAASMRALVGDSLSLNVGNIATAIASLVIAFNASWELALVVLALVPLIGINSLIQIKSMNGFSNNSKSMYEEASQVANDAVGGIRTVASFSAEDKVMDMYKTRCEAPLKSGIRQGLISGIGFGVSFFFLYNIYAITFYVGARLVDSGTTTFTQVFQVFYALTMAATGITHSSSISQDTTKAKAAAASVFAILDRKSKIDPSDESGTILPDLKGEIELKHISFKYPSRPNIQIFRDLNLHIHAGKTIALVGESGSGKSTVIALLQRFYDPDSGTITIDGVEIQKLQLKWLRQQIGLVSQEPVLFNETVRANIAYGKASEEEIIRAAETANAHSFISGLQHGYETTVGERGVQLSGGQKQRVAIARAIMKNPKILLLDEATSALDAESERVVQEAVDRVMVNRTTVVVAHRLSTIMNADCIAVVRNGNIVENGKHEELITIKQGFYASLIQLHASAVAPTPNSSS